MPIAVARSLHLKPGDDIAWESTPMGLSGRRIPAGVRLRTKRRSHPLPDFGEAMLLVRPKTQRSGQA